MTQTKLYETGRNYTLSVVPLFILMGNFVTRAGMSQELFRAAYAFIGHRGAGWPWPPSGPRPASAASAARPSPPRHLRQGRLSLDEEVRLLRPAGRRRVAGGGTLGIMIPPSTIMVIYGIFTETNIGKLFAAGVIPERRRDLAVRGGAVHDLAGSALGTAGRALSWRERFLALKDVWAVAALFFVMGGIYGGFFTATEGAAMGAFGAMIFALGRRALTWRALYAALLESARTTAMLFLILIGP
jgi:TRAP-type C4-dicarboxylate transport system permease large subunit